jgi:hypothetical protein
MPLPIFLKQIINNKRTDQHQIINQILKTINKQI